MATPVNVLYEFGPFQLDPPERLLLCDGQPVSLTPKAFDLLLALVDRSGHLVEKEELLRTVWPGSFIEEGNLAVTISLLRKALNDDRGQHRYIETVSKKGYRFVAEVKRLDDSALVIASPKLREAAAAAPVIPPLSIPDTPWTPPAPKKRTRFLMYAGVAASLVTIIALGVGHRRDSAKQKPSVPVIGSLAVLPFQALGTDSPNQYLELGMADAVITKLANTGRITVRPTSSIQQYVGTHLSPQEIGREQGVDAVLDGRIQRDADRVRVTVQLIRVRDGVQLWADTFDRKFTDVFALEDALADMAAQSIRLNLTGAESVKFTKRSTENPAAYEAYIKGRYFWNKRTDSGLKKGLDYFQQAIKLDPGFAEAYVGVADSYAMLGLYAVIPPTEAFPAAKDAATRALQMDDGLATAHATLGFINFYYDWNVAVAGNEFRRALNENPHYAMAHSWYGESLAAKGDYANATVEAQRALQDDPLSMIVSSNAGWTFALAGQYDRSIETLKKAIDIDPSFPRTHFRLAEVYEQRRQYALAIPEFEEAVSLSGGDPYYEGSLGHAYGVSGDASRARSVVRNLQNRPANQYVPPYAIALIYAGLGEKGQALQWLQKAGENRCTPMVFLRSDPELAGIRSDPGFAPLAQLLSF